MKKLLAVSGGPDSMFMLNKYKKRNIVVAHVNYHIRSDSNIDQKIVEEFCKIHNIPLEILSVKEKLKGNFQSWARKVRYDFFENIYIKYNTNILLIAHHKDDFIETALMQHEAKRTPKFFGIRKKSVYGIMRIYRPYIDLYWKKDMLNYLHKNKIKYAIDSSNEEKMYKRNQIRKKIKNFDQEKEKIYSWYKMSNRILKKKNKKVSYWKWKWQKSDYSTLVFQFMKYKNEILFDVLHEKFVSLNVTSKKIDSIIDYIESNNGGKEYRLSSHQFLLKKKSKLYFINKRDRI